MTTKLLHFAAKCVALAGLLVCAPSAFAGQVRLDIEIGDFSTPPTGPLTPLFHARCIFLVPPNTIPEEEDCGSDLPIANNQTANFPNHNVANLVAIRLSQNPYPDPQPTWTGRYLTARHVNNCTPDCLVLARVYSSEGSFYGHVELSPGLLVPARVFSYKIPSPPVGPNGTAIPFKYKDGAEFDFEEANPMGNRWGVPVTVWNTVPPNTGGDTYVAKAFPMGTPASPFPDFVDDGSFSDVFVQSNSRALLILTLSASTLEHGFNPDDTRPGFPEPVPTVGGTGEDEVCPSGRAVGNPVDVITGNVYFDQVDAVVGGGRRPLDLRRSYNSNVAYAGRGGLFGRGWHSSYEKTITQMTPQLLRLEPGSGLVVYFADADGDGTFEPLRAGERSWIVRTASPVTYTRHFKEGGQEAYSAGGKLVSQSDLFGILFQFTWTGNRLTSLRIPGGRQFTLGYGGQSDLVSSLTGPDGLIAEYSYVDGRLVEVDYAGTDAGGYTFTYNDAGQVLRVEDATDRVLERHEYYTNGKGRTSEVDGGVEKYTLSYSGGVTTVVDALGRETKYYSTTAAGMKKIAKIEGGCAGCGGGDVEEWGYNTDGRVNLRTDGAGKQTSYIYVNGRVRETHAPLGRTTITIRDNYGRVLSIENPEHEISTWTYVDAGPEIFTDGTQRTTHFTYDPATGLVETITDGRGKVTTFEYTNGDLTAMKDALNHYSRFTYYPMGWLKTAKDPLNRVTTTFYDARGRVRLVKAHDLTEVSFTYDLGGRRLSGIDQLNRSTVYTYDPYGRLSFVRNAAEGVTRYEYDKMSRLRAVVDAKGQTTRFEYDRGDRLAQQRYPGDRVESFTYDEAGRIRTRTSRNGVLIRFTYDDAARLTKKEYSDGTPRIDYTYDKADRMLTAATETDTLTWIYDDAGRMLSETSSRNGATVAFDYDDAGNRDELRLNGSLFLGYEYDDLNRLWRLNRNGALFILGYNDISQRTTLDLPNGAHTTYDYDPATARLMLLRTVVGPNVVAEWTYAYDAGGNRTSKVRPAIDETTYSYDASSHLAATARPTPVKSQVYRYDAAGNRTSEQAGDSTVNATLVSMSYSARNELSSRAVGGNLIVRGSTDTPSLVTVNGAPARMLEGDLFEAAVPAVAGTNFFTIVATDDLGRANTKVYRTDLGGAPATFVYDLNGNLIEKTESGSVWRYGWSAENELLRACVNVSPCTNTNALVYFAYDPLGRRVEKIAGGVTTKWVYDGLDILRETIMGGPGAGVYTYVHGPSADEPLLRAAATGTLTYYHPDELGSIVVTTNSSGQVVATRVYDVWGNIESGNQDAGFAFAGREWEPELGLYYYRSRYYDAKSGRFISEDPLGLPSGLNLYDYVGSNPTGRKDPTGLTDDSSPWSLGLEWLTGLGPTGHSFGPGDPMTDMLRQHAHIQNILKQVRQQVDATCLCGGRDVTFGADAPYKLNGLQGIGKYIRDYSTLVTFGHTGNLAVTFLGGYNLSYGGYVTCADRSGSIGFSVVNTSTMTSGFRPPFIGYLPGWKYVEPILNHGWGPMGTTTQIFQWSEPVY